MSCKTAISKSKVMLTLLVGVGEIQLQIIILERNCPQIQQLKHPQ